MSHRAVTCLLHPKRKCDSQGVQEQYAAQTTVVALPESARCDKKFSGKVRSFLIWYAVMTKVKPRPAFSEWLNVSPLADASQP
jgi:hypothetical protein